ncbi:MAG: hypothetical protein ABJB47_13455, partial [Actinomycetota bacterium]
ADHDYQVNENLRFVQLTPPGSACSIVMGTGITKMPPGSQQGLQMVVADGPAARQHRWTTGWRPVTSTSSPGDRSARSATRTATPGRCRNSRRN